MHRTWHSLKDCSTCQAVVVLYDSTCLMHMGAARAGHKPEDALLGPICRKAMSSEQGNYLANLALYPGRCTMTPAPPLTPAFRIDILTLNCTWVQPAAKLVFS